VVSAALKHPFGPAVEPAPSPIEIALRDVAVSYPSGRTGAKTVLAGINLEIAAGEFVVVLGETGCGKSTLLRLILGQEYPTRGSVHVNGSMVGRIDARCGYVPQKYSLFPDRTLLQNVMFGPENARGGVLGRLRPSFIRFRRELRGQAEACLGRMGLRLQDMGKYPHQLSGGMQQRVAIAQALMMNPPVLLMDEALSALDPSTRGSLQEQLHSIWLESRPTVVFVTHNTSEALLLGTRLILLRPHGEDRPGESNVVLDMQIPPSSLPLGRRRQTPEFRQLRERVQQLAYRTCTINRTDDSPEELPVEGLLQ
jgi:NitT/TauT family transport system ATP-binding protein